MKKQISEIDEMPVYPKWHLGSLPSLMSNWTCRGGDKDCKRYYDITDLRFEKFTIEYYSAAPYELAAHTEDGSLIIIDRYHSLDAAQAKVADLQKLSDNDLIAEYGQIWTPKNDYQI